MACIQKYLSLVQEVYSFKRFCTISSIL